MKVLITDGMAEPAVQMMRDAGLEVDLRTGVSADEVLGLIPDFDAICIRSATKVTAEVIAAGTKLKAIGRAGVGLDNVDRATAKEKGIPVLNTPSATAESVAELAIGHMLCLARFISEADATMKADQWEKKRMTGTEVGGKTLGVIGTGSIGRAVMVRARALGMNVICTKQNLSTIPDELTKLDVPVVPFDELLPQCDYISLHLPLTDTTRDLISAKTLAQMKDGVYLINCARGGVVNEADLAEAVRGGKVAGAGVDVYAEEPVKSNPFEGLARVIQTPHLGASTAEGQLRASTQLAEQIIAALK